MSPYTPLLSTSYIHSNTGGNYIYIRTTVNISLLYTKSLYRELIPMYPRLTYCYTPGLHRYCY